MKLKVLLLWIWRSRKGFHFDDESIIERENKLSGGTQAVSLEKNADLTLHQLFHLLDNMKSFLSQVSILPSSYLCLRLARFDTMPVDVLDPCVVGERRAETFVGRESANRCHQWPAAFEQCMKLTHAFPQLDEIRR